MDVLSPEISQITEKIIGCAFKVSNTLGIGFVEKVYENSLTHEVRKTKLQVKQQHTICVYYDQKLVGEFFADLLVEEKVLVELKVVCLNYLRASDLPVCLLINIGRPKIEIKRILPSDVWKPVVYGRI